MVQVAVLIRGNQVSPAVKALVQTQVKALPQDTPVLEKNLTTTGPKPVAEIVVVEILESDAAAVPVAAVVQAATVAVAIAVATAMEIAVATVTAVAVATAMGTAVATAMGTAVATAMGTAAATVKAIINAVCAHKQFVKNTGSV